MNAIAEVIQTKSCLVTSKYYIFIIIHLEHIHTFQSPSHPSPSDPTQLRPRSTDILYGR